VDVNLKMIAQKANVSISTVSRVLNGRSGVKPAIRVKVLEIMDKFDFCPATVVNEAKEIGILLALRPNPFQSTYIMELLKGITKIAFPSDFELSLIPQKSFLGSKIGVRQYCRSRGIKGLLALAPLKDTPLPSKLVGQKIPYLIVGSTYKDKAIDWIDVDNTTASFKAVEYLIKLGHRRIGLINSSLQLQCFLDRAKGYQLALEKYGIPIYDDLIINEPVGIDISDYFVNRLVHLKNIPTALFVTSHLHSVNIMDALKQHGIRVPQDVSIVGFGDYQITSYTSPPLTTVHQPVLELGEIAVETLLKIIQGEIQSPIQITLKAGLIVRGSTANPRSVNKVLNLT